MLKAGAESVTEWCEKVMANTDRTEKDAQG